MRAAAASPHRALVSCAATLVLGIAIACGPSGSRVEGIHARTARHGASATNVTEVERTAAGIKYAWDVQAPRSWEEYRTTLIESFTPDFRVVTNDATSLVLAQRAPGDVYRLEFQVTATMPLTMVHVVFTAVAD